MHDFNYFWECQIRIAPTAFFDNMEKTPIPAFLKHRGYFNFFFHFALMYPEI